MPTRHAGSFWKNAMTCQALQLPANNHLADSINTVHLKDRLSDIKTDCCDRLHAWLLRIVGASTGSTSMALACRWRSRPQHQKQIYAVQQIRAGDWILAARPSSTWPRSASAVLPRETRRGVGFFATGQREDCSVECGSLSLAGLESGVSQPSFWPPFSFSTARLMKSCMPRFAFAGNSNAM